MKLTRRNALIGLGSLVAGSGALVGTGAFSSVEADRTVNISTSGDSAALAQFSVSGSLGGSGDTISFNESEINADAVTTYQGALTITIPQSTEGTTYDVDIEDGNGNDIHRTSSQGANETNSAPSFQLVGGSSDPLTFDTSSSDDSTSLDVVVNTAGTTSGGTSIGVSTVTFTVTDTT